MGEQPEGAWVSSMSSAITGLSTERPGTTGRKWSSCPQPWFLPSQPGQAPCLCGYSHISTPPRLYCKGVESAEALPLLGQHLSSTLGDKNAEANSACGWQHEGRSGSSGYRHPRGSSVASLLLPTGDLCTKGFPRVAAAHLWPSRVRARLPSPGKLQRVLSAVPSHTLGRRHLLPRRSRSPVRTVLPVCAPPLFPGIRALSAAQADSPIRERARTLAAGGDGCTGLASPLPPRHATDCALQMAPDAPADGLRRRPSESAELEIFEQNAGVPAPESQFLIKVPTTVPSAFSGSERVAYRSLESPNPRQMQSGFGRLGFVLITVLSSRQHLACAATSALTILSRDSHPSPTFLYLGLTFLSG